LASSALSKEDFWFNGFFDQLLFGSRDELLNGLIEDDLNGSIDELRRGSMENDLEGSIEDDRVGLRILASFSTTTLFSRRAIAAN